MEFPSSDNYRLRTPKTLASIGAIVAINARLYHHGSGHTPVPMDIMGSRVAMEANTSKGPKLGSQGQAAEIPKNDRESGGAIRLKLIPGQVVVG
jgi:hypothetical protein